MKTLLRVIVLLSLLSLISYNVIVISQLPFTQNQRPTTTPPLEGCSVLTCTLGNTTLFGYNLDGHDYLTPFISFGNHLQFQDGEIQYFGKLVAATGRMTNIGPRDGYAEFTLEGFCSAGNSLATVPMYIDPLKTNYTPGVDGPGVVGECSTVEEAISFFNEHNYIRSDPPQWWWQHHFADALGESVVIAVDEEGRVGFTEMNESHYTVSTNHNLLDITNYDGNLYNSIQRYDLACDMLDEITSEEELTVDAIRDVLEALSADSTTHSLIMNPRTLDIYIYIPEDYTKTICFNLEEELAMLGVNETRLYNITELYENLSQSSSTSSTPSLTSTSSTIPTSSPNITPTSIDIDPTFIVLLAGGSTVLIIAAVLLLRRSS